MDTDKEGSLYIFADNTISYSKWIEAQLDPLSCPIGDHLILFVEVIVESWRVSISFRPRNLALPGP